MAKIYSMNAEEEAKQKIHRIKLCLEDIAVAMGKYESLQRFHYGYVGDLHHIENLLNDVYIFICQTKD